MDVHLALRQFVTKYNLQVDENKRQISYDPDWPSPCVQADDAAAGDWVTWQAVEQQENISFDNLETALELHLHPDIKAYYSSFWSENLKAKAEQGNCELLLAWSVKDFERLQENLIGHVLMKRRLKQPITVFFGLTDEVDFILTVDNDSGAVMLEQVGCEPSRELAPSLAAFLQALEPFSE